MAPIQEVTRNAACHQPARHCPSVRRNCQPGAMTISDISKIAVPVYRVDIQPHIVISPVVGFDRDDNWPG
jgi:hypothetical protein